MLRPSHSLAAVTLTCLLAACGGVTIPPTTGGGTTPSMPGNPSPTPAPTVTTGIQGVLTAGNAAEPLSNALVQVQSSGKVVASATTDSSGSFTVSVPAGTYTLLSAGQNLVAAVNQGGSAAQPFASSEVVGVQVVSGSLTAQNIIQVPATGGSLPTTPPSVSVSNIPATLDAQGTLQPHVTVDTTTNSVFYVVSAIGQVPFRNVFARKDRALLYTGGQFGEAGVTTHVEYPAMTGVTGSAGPFPVGQLAAGLSGNTYVETLALDNNNNRTLVLTPVTIGNIPAGTSMSAAVSGVNAIGYTIANGRFNPQGLNAQAAVSGTLSYATVTWSPYAFATKPAAGKSLDQGYRVYRTRNGGAKTLLGSVARYATASGAVVNPTTFTDVDPALTPGDTLSYTVVAFDGQQNAPESSASPAGILAPLTVKLTSPADQATGVSVTPTFTWQTNNVGKVQYFVPALGDVLQGGAVFCGVQPSANPANPLIDTLQQSALTSTRGFYFSATRCGVSGGGTGGSNSFTYAPGQDYTAFLPPLQSARAYQWRLLEAVAADDPVNTHALSVFSDDAGLFFTASRYGLPSFDGDQVYTFTTGGNQ